MRPLRGQGISQFAGAQHYHGVQLGFPAKITSAYSSTTGYEWARMAVVSPDGVQDATTPLTGNRAFAIDGNEEIAVGTQVWIEPDGGAQGYVIVQASAAAGDATGPIPCTPHGWLVDKQALIDRFSDNLPKGVLSVEIYPGETGSRCECIPEQFTENAVQPYDGIAQAFYVSGTDTWDLTRLVTTCCSCAFLQIELPDNDGTADTWPPVSGTLTLNEACDATAASYVLRYQCSTRDAVVFAAAGPKLCTDDPAPVICDNAFYIVVRCDDCAYENVLCEECSEVCNSSLSGPPIFRVTASGFTGGDDVYNGTWYLWFVEDCEWEVTCGGITITVALTPTGTNDTTQLTVTFTGGANGAVFQYNSPEIIVGVGTNVTCFEEHTAAWVSGNDPTQPASVTVTPIYCEPCDDLCPLIDFENMTADVISSTGDCDCVVLTWASFVAGLSATFGLTGCDNNVQVHVRCAGGRLRVDISGSATQSFAEVSLVVSSTVFEWTVDIGFVGDPLDPCAGTFRVVFSSPVLP